MEERLKRLRFRAWHRGTREADYMIGGFFDRYAAEWGEAEIRWYELVVEEDDVDIMSWALGTGEPPAHLDNPPADRRNAPTGLHPPPMTRPAADIFAAIASAPAPLTLARAADGFLPLLLADLARASDKRLVYVATDDAAMQAVADAAPFFAPDLTVHRFPRVGLPSL
jgi:antitoxin CptB